MTVTESSVYELRQYTLRPGTRDAFVDLFDREFVETQEAAGILVVGQYRDLDQPDVFVWIRGFADMPSRRASLEAFYDGPVWAAHGQAANSMMLDSDNVLLLAPLGGRPSLDGSTVPRPPVGASRRAGNSIMVADIYPVGGASTAQLSDIYEQMIKPSVAQSGGQPLAALRTTNAVNTFPRLPVREGEDVFVTVVRFPDQAAHARQVRDLAPTPTRRAWRSAPGPLAGHRAQTLRLAPTPRSALI